MRTDQPATWFRLYAEFATDPKVQMLSEADQRRFLMVLCLRCRNGDVTLHDEEIAFQLRISGEEWQATKNTLYKRELIDSGNKLTKWKSRQFDSDTSNARVKKLRTLRKSEQKASSNGDVTLQEQKSNALETETETETEINTKKKDKKKIVSADAPPDGVSISVWQDFIAIRKTKKAALTATAIKLIQSQADKAGVTLQSALETCCERGWASYNVNWLKNINGSANSTETPFQRSQRELYERAIGQRRPAPVIDVQGALQ